MYSVTNTCVTIWLVATSGLYPLHKLRTQLTDACYTCILLATSVQPRFVQMKVSVPRSFRPSLVHGQGHVQPRYMVSQFRWLRMTSVCTTSWSYVVIDWPGECANRDRHVDLLLSRQFNDASTHTVWVYRYAFRSSASGRDVGVSKLRHHQFYIVIISFQFMQSFKAL